MNESMRKAQKVVALACSLIEAHEESQRATGYAAYMSDETRKAMNALKEAITDLHQITWDEC